MHALQSAIGIVWAAFWIYWLAAAFGAKRSTHRLRRLPLNGVTAVAVFVVVRVLRTGGLAVNTPVLGAVGAALLLAGLALAVWARVHLGRNWGMPMTEKEEPELVTSGPYRFARHPIYSGLILAVVGTALATNLIGLLIAAVLIAYFYYCASFEEKNLITTFPTAYPAYRHRTKMLIPFVF